jgi:hypothetical protein
LCIEHLQLSKQGRNAVLPRFAGHNTLRPLRLLTWNVHRCLGIDGRISPARIADVTPEMVSPFFESPWPASVHPLRYLS